jgi:hypothetical protein
MTRSVRSVLLCLAALVALGAAGCGNKEDSTNLGSTEGIYVTVDDLKYQIQISRILNPADREDQSYLIGLPPGEEPAKDEVWFGIFMRVENDTGQERPAAEDFKIVDTQGQEFEPIEVDTSLNAFDYEPRPIPAGQLLPQVGTAASDNTIQGELILFKVKAGSLYNRPLEFEILSRSGHADDARIDLDV